ncbi:MAG: COQ9 family protein, partial [Alphaproteobacteria bacterium]
VYSSTALFWIGDDSEGDRETWAFLDRRIANVMQFEKAKARARENPLVGPLLSAPGKLFGRVRAPASAPRHGAPR